MEPAPLTQAHAHARSARLDASSAAEQHAHAAGEFAQAAKGTADTEALRTLRLLERHHQKLHQILRSRLSPPHPGAAQTDLPDPVPGHGPPTAAAKPVSAPAPPTDRSSSPYRQPHQLPTLGPAHRPPPRDLTSSIASNLASARGIPSSQRRRGNPASPALSADQAGGRILNTLEKRGEIDPRQTYGQSESKQTRRAGQEAADQKRKPLDEGSISAELGSGTMAKSAAAAKQDAAPSLSSESFQRFYSTFENLISKLSAPLAFAGLPLAGDPSNTVVPDRPTNVEKAAERETGDAEPDLSKIFSRAALRAVKDRGGLNSLGAAAESFYVVPTTGGTISYAGILSRAEQERRAGADGREHLEDDEEPEFVDASETPQPPSPEKSRHGAVGRAWRYGSRSQARSRGGSTKTLEELQVENQALKQLSDTLSRRLHMWEMNAQSSSIALQHSLRALQRSPAASDAGKSIVGEDPSDRLRDVEEQLRTTTREMEKLGRENEKLKGVVLRYREKWEKLKEGARMRREGTKTDDVVKE